MSRIYIVLLIVTENHPLKEEKKYGRIRNKKENEQRINITIKKLQEQKIKPSFFLSSIFRICIRDLRSCTRQA